MNQNPFVKFIKSMVPAIERDTVLEDINNNAGILKNATIPAYKQAAEFLGKHKFTAPEIETFVRNFERDQKTGIKGNFILVIYEVAKRIEGNTQVLISMAESTFSDTIIASAMTYKKVSVLQYIESVTFFQRYARRLLLWTYTLETQANGYNGPDTISKDLSPGEVKWLQDNMSAFIAILEPLSLKASAIEKFVAEIPDLMITEETADAMQQTRGHKLDPFRMNFIAAKFNLIYHIRMRIAEWQKDSYDASLQEKKTLEFRLLHLRNVLDGKADPKLEKILEVEEARLAKLNAKIARMEEEYV